MKIIFALTLCFVPIILAVDYCSKEIGCFWANHTACGHSGEKSKNCPEDTIIYDLTPYKDIIVDRHNYYRNQIAIGNVTGFKTAVRMRTLRWDDELASIAVLHMKNCADGHDRCRNTERYKYAGQNGYGIGAFKAPGESLEFLAADCVKSWWNELEFANMGNMDSVPNPAINDDWEKIGHLTQILLDRAESVGCGGSAYTAGGMYDQKIYCNYGGQHMFPHPVYVSGPIASKCETGTNPKYPGLCSEAEDFDPNWSSADEMFSYEAGQAH